MKIAGIKTGTGGGGSHTAEYDVKLFAEDFPGLVYGLGTKPVFKPYGSRGEIINYMDDERFVPLNRMFFYGGKLLRPDVRYYLETNFGRERNDWKPGMPYDDWGFHYHGRDYIEFRSNDNAYKFRSQFTLEYQLEEKILRVTSFKSMPPIADPFDIIEAYKKGKIITLDLSSAEMGFRFFDRDEHDLSLYFLSHPTPNKILRII